MSLTKTWAPFFQSRIRMRGRSYQLEHRVSQIPPHSDKELLRATVQGTELYTVVIQGDNQYATAYCTCPAFKAGQYCKHIWAALLDVHTNGVTHMNPNTPALTSGIIPRLPKAKERDIIKQPLKPREPEWIDHLSMLRKSTSIADSQQIALPTQPAVCYIINASLSARHNCLVVELRQHQSIETTWSRLKSFKLSNKTVRHLANQTDREICSLILGPTPIYEDSEYYQFRSTQLNTHWRINPGAQKLLLRRMIETERCYINTDDINITNTTNTNNAANSTNSNQLHTPHLTYDTNNTPWSLWLTGDMPDDHLTITIELRRDNHTIPIDKPQLILGNTQGLVILDNMVSAFNDSNAYRWVTHFRDEFPQHSRSPIIHIPHNEIAGFLDRLYMMPQLPEIDLPQGIGRPEKHITPIPCLDIFSFDTIAQPPRTNGNKSSVTAKLSFDYNQTRISPYTPGRFVTHPFDETALDSTYQTNTTTTNINSNNINSDNIINAAADNNTAKNDTNDVTDTTTTATTINSDNATDTTDATNTADATYSPHDPNTQPSTHAATHPLIRRDHELERRHIAKLLDLGLKPDSTQNLDSFLLPTKLISSVVSELLTLGWIVEADRKLIHQSDTPSLSITSGIDWFELRGQFQYKTARGLQFIQLPDILKAAQTGRSMITLDDGSQGILPYQWLEEHNLLADIATLEDDHLRFRSSQAVILDALLAKQRINLDARFRELRRRLNRFNGITPADTSERFVGKLRPYQRDGLGWLEFLKWFSMGGILADDMGLGKTIQVLAILDKHYKSLQNTDEHHQPSLVIVPKSVIYNWIDESHKFTPDLRVLDYSGIDRHEMRKSFNNYDLIVTSYGLLRRDITELQHHNFDFAILDEAQAIKNPASQSAKATRLLNAKHRLALSGTPVENHLGDIWSIFEFVNPGMLGTGTKFADMFRGNQQEKNKIEAARQTGVALKPFILRRTKKQVLKDLPEKTEQTIVCQMEPEQRQIYDELREHYRATLLNKIDSTRTARRTSSIIGGNAMIVLEALLRLRQAACHPALIDPEKEHLPSAKLDTLMEQLDEIIDEGHKTLVFSQFTSMLALVRKRLDSESITYEYLDGQTRKRKECVERFQNDPDCPVFLISLKAGGLGLNLTAAEYVYILDPWWNPAVESQAIDRAHRIGQTRHVFAYRLICQDTVEQRIAELQDKKRKLADAIVGGQENLLRSLTRDDLERLLS